MNQDLECVLAILRAEVRAATFSEQQLEQAFNRAEKEKVLPLFVSKIRHGGYPLSEKLQARCAVAEREFAASTFWWTSELKGILNAFASANVLIILLKGPSFAERVYNGRALRLSRDLDLLISQKDLVSAGGILATLGFVRREEQAMFHEQWLRATTMIELHFGLADEQDFAVNSEIMCERAQPVMFSGVPAHVLSPPHELFFLCLHGARHGYEQLTYVMDVALAWEEFGPPSAHEDFSGNEELIPLVLLGHAMACHITPVQLPPSFFVNKKLLRKIERISGILWSRISLQPTRLSLWHFPRRLPLALQPTFLAQLKLLWAISGRVCEEDRVFATKFHVEDRRLVWAARQLRLFLELIQRKS